VQGERFDLRLPWLFSDGICHYEPAPLFGEHTREVYEGLLGKTGAEIESLKAAAVIA
jgi:crotonobetainyl-CoA:carnitine CoA-transferase CaiB-like acyl-CoA transferase